MFINKKWESVLQKKYYVSPIVLCPVYFSYDFHSLENTAAEPWRRLRVRGHRFNPSYNLLETECRTMLPLLISQDMVKSWSVNLGMFSLLLPSLGLCNRSRFFYRTLPIINRVNTFYWFTFELIVNVTTKKITQPSRLSFATSSEVADRSTWRSR